MRASHHGEAVPLRHQLTGLLRTLDQAMGQRDAMQKREGQLVHDVGLAKGRLEVKPKVDAFLAELQADANDRAVGAYSRLLTGLVADVLGTQAGTVELDLYTHHGLPALDLNLRTPGGKKVSILNNTAGSFINLVCLGLRATSTVRSGKRRFIALDEPDCWIRPSRVPLFYGVIDQLAKSLGIQILVVSHHDSSLLPDTAAIFKLRLGASGTIEVEADPEAQRWEEGQDGIRSLQLTDFRTHQDSSIPLSPGVTAIVGDNSIGKSHVLHALRSLCYGDVEDGDLRDDEEVKRLRVEMEIENGTRLCLTRQPGRNPVNEWSVLDGEGELVFDEESGHPLKKGGRVPPDFIQSLSGIMRMEGLDPQLSHQLFPVFLLGEPPSKRASVLSIGRESGHISSMIARQKARCQQDSATVRKGEKEIADLRESLKRLETLDEINVKAAECQKRLDAIEAEQGRIQRMHSLLERYGKVYARHQKSVSMLEAYEKLPSDGETEEISQAVRAGQRDGAILERWTKAKARHDRDAALVDRLSKLPAEPPQIEDVEHMRRMGARYVSLTSHKQYYESLITALGALPEEPPHLIDTRGIADGLRRVDRLEARRQEQANEAARLNEAQEAAKKKIDEILSGMGNACPTCGSHVDSADTIIAHGVEHRTNGVAHV